MCLKSSQAMHCCQPPGHTLGSNDRHRGRGRRLSPQAISHQAILRGHGTLLSHTPHTSTSPPCSLISRWPRSLISPHPVALDTGHSRNAEALLCLEGSTPAQFSFWGTLLLAFMIKLKYCLLCEAFSVKAQATLCGFPVCSWRAREEPTHLLL